MKLQAIAVLAMLSVLLAADTALGYYNQSLGRWTSEDPLGIDPAGALSGNPWRRAMLVAGGNTYEYGVSDPVMKSDPHGMVPPVIVGVAAAAAIACVAPVLHAHAMEQRSWNNDKYAHCVVSCRISKICGREIAAMGGWTKEAMDELRKQLGGDPTGWDPADLAANSVGRSCAGWETFLPFSPISWVGSALRQSCDCCCQKAGHSPWL